MGKVSVTLSSEIALALDSATAGVGEMWWMEGGYGTFPLSREDCISAPKAVRSKTLKCHWPVNATRGGNLPSDGARSQLPVDVFHF